MSDQRLNLQYVGWLLLVAGTGFLLYLLAPILTPFLLAAILAYICNPLVDRMARHGVPRAAGAAIVLVLLLALFAAVLLVVLPLLVRQGRAMIVQVPLYLDWLRSAAEPWLLKHFGVQLDVDLLKQWMAEHLAEIQSVAVKILPSLKTGGLALVGFIVDAVLVLVVLFYFLRDWSLMLQKVGEIVPRRWHARFLQLFGEIDAVLGEFLRGQLLVMLLMGVFYTVGLRLAGLDYAVSVGMIAGLVTFVPYLGVVTGVLLATLTGLLQFQDLTALAWIWLVFVIGNVLEGYVFVPFLVGERVGLHPVLVIFSLLAFGQLFGFFGVLLAVPASAALLVWLRHVRRQYLESGVYKA